MRRKEATRTPDPYVPNVVRYQLRYFPIAVAKVSIICDFTPTLSIFFHLRRIFLYNYLHRREKTPTFAPANPKRRRATVGVIAQLVEQRTENPCVPGSIPGDTTQAPVDRWSTGASSHLQSFNLCVLCLPSILCGCERLFNVHVSLLIRHSSPVIRHSSFITR